MRRFVIAAAMGLAAVGATAGTASASIYKVDVRGSQKVTWSFDGEIQVGGCASEDGNFPITRQYTGEGSMVLSFKSAKPASGVVMRTGRKLYASFGGGVVKATGNLQGSWVKSETRGGCPDSFAPDPAEVEPTSACGAQSWTMFVNGENRSNFLHITGKEDLSAPASPSRSDYTDCPLALSSGIELQRIGQPGPCEQQSVDGHRLSWELAALGRGIANTRIAMKAKEAGKKRIALAKRTVKKCLIPISSGANGTKPVITVDVVTQVSVVMRRTVK
jgi:hypothetical protein